MTAEEDSEISRLFLDHSIVKLNRMTAAIQLCLGKLSDDRIWLRGSGNENAIGNLILHLCGNVTHYIGHLVAGAPDIRDRPSEFSAVDASGAALTRKLSESISAACHALRAVTPGRLTDRVTTTDGETTIVELIYQVVGHFQQHAGQIIFATKQITGEDLQIYRAPSR